MNVRIAEDSKLRSARVLLPALLVVVILLWFTWHFVTGGGGDSSDKGAPTVELNELPMATILEPPGCDPDGCHLWWQYDETSDTWLIHAGNAAAAQTALEHGAMLTKVPT